MNLNNINPQVKKIIAYITILMIVVVLAFCGGRYSAPTKIEYKEKIVEKTSEQATKKTEAAVKATVDVTKDKAKTVKKHSVTVKKPDGTIITIVDTSISDVFKESVRKALTSDLKVEEKTNKTTEKTKDVFSKTETIRPEWNFRLMVGVNPTNITVPIGFNTFVYGLSVEKRVFGPLYFGLWGLTSKTFGVSLSLNI